jgi:hypothetical protein
MEQTEATITIEGILAAMEQTWTRLERVLEQFEPVLDAGPDDGGWTPRQVLSHLTGAWQRVPIHSAFFLTGGAEVPIVFGDSYWIPEWENAPLEAFTLAMRAAYEGNRKFARDLVPGDLSRTAGTRFGVMTLGQFLMTSYESHIGNFHVPQLEAFLTRQV